MGWERLGEKQVWEGKKNKPSVVLWMSHSSGGGKCAGSRGWALCKGTGEYL